MKNLLHCLLVVMGAIISCTDHDQEPFSEMDRQFMISAADGNMFEIKAGEVATQKAAHDSVKAYGHHMVTDHSMASQELMALALKKSVNLPGSLSTPKQMKIDSLNAKTGMDFDTTYMNMMVSSHIETVSLFEKETAQGNDSEVKSWTAAKLPTLKHHLEKAKQLRNLL